MPNGISVLDFPSDLTPDPEAFVHVFDADGNDFKVKLKTLPTKALSIDLEEMDTERGYAVGEAFHYDGKNYRVKIDAVAGETPATHPEKFDQLLGAEGRRIKGVYTPDGSLPNSGNTVPAVVGGYSPEDGDKFQVSESGSVGALGFYKNQIIEYSSQLGAWRGFGNEGLELSNIDSPSVALPPVVWGGQNNVYCAVSLAQGWPADGVVYTYNADQGANKSSFQMFVPLTSANGDSGLQIRYGYRTSSSGDTWSIWFDVSGVNDATLSAIDDAVAALIDSSPASMDTLNELAAALGDDANFATTMTNLLAEKASITALNNEAQTRENNDDALQQNIEDEAQEREDGDGVLEQQIDSVIPNYVARQTLIDAATIAVDLAPSGIKRPNKAITLTTDGRTLGNPTNGWDGAAGHVLITQGAGGFSLGLEGQWQLKSGDMADISALADGGQAILEWVRLGSGKYWAALTTE